MIAQVIVVIACVLVAVKAGYSSDAEADRVVNLPFAQNLGTTDFGFSGYLAINGSDGASKQQHYWMIEAEENKDSAPVAFCKWKTSSFSPCFFLSALSRRSNNDTEIYGVPLKYSSDMFFVQSELITLHRYYLTEFFFTTLFIFSSFFFRDQRRSRLLRSTRCLHRAGPFPYSQQGWNAFQEPLCMEPEGQYGVHRAALWRGILLFHSRRHHCRL